MDSVNQEISNHLKQRIDEYRQKLLDLSTTNVLISFKHDLKSKAHVRIIDERFDVVFEKLVQGRELELLPLPEPRELPDDEGTAGFVSALDRFKVEDPIYLEQRDSLQRKPASKEDLDKLERRARDRVRHNLGMPPWTPEAELTPAELARAYGLEPDFDLAKPNGADTPDRHLDEALQTLHTTKALDDKLRGLGERARSSVREVGIGTLYCAYGFLEWHDDQDKTARFAPLFLQSAGLRRQLARGRYRYFVSGADQPVAHNASLDHYLRKRFAIALPRKDDDDTPETYFEKIESWLVCEKPRWRLRRFLTIGVFPFSKLALYEDLNLDNWTDRQGFIGHPTIRQLLASAGDSASPVADDYRLDEFDFDRQLPPLIYEADSSQHSAIVDALSGRNIAIQGPPGTGKSQTIANILAAAMAAGKTVLFIAEKQAALDVVADRLKKAGLGDYCLVLHAHDEKKQAIVQSFGDRLQMAEPPFDQRLYEQTRQEWLKTRLVLKDYAEVMASPVGRLSETVHDILWKALWAARQVSRPCLDDIALESVEALTDADLRNARDGLRQLDSAWRAVVDDRTGTPISVWQGVGRTQATPLVVDDAVRRAQRWLDAVERASVLLTDAPSAPEESFATREGFDRHARLVEILPHLPNSPWLMASAPQLLRIDERERVLARARDLRAFQAVTEALAAYGNPALTEGRSIAELEALLNEVRSSGVCAHTPAGLRDEAARAQAAAEAISGIVSVVAQIGRILELEGSPESLLPLALKTADCLAAAEPRLLWARTSALVDLRNRQAIEDAETRYNELVKARGELARGFRVEQLPAVSELRSHAEALRTSSLPPWLDARVRRATLIYRTIALEPGKSGRHRMAACLDELADFLTKSLAFTEDREFRALFGPGFRGLDTDLTRFREVSDWAAAVGRQFRGLDPQHQRIRDALHHGDGPLLDELLDLGSRLRDLVRQAGLETGAMARPLSDLERSARERASSIQLLFDRLRPLGLVTVDQPLDAFLNELIGKLRRRADLVAAFAAEAPAGPEPGRATEADLALLAQLNGIVLDAGLAAVAFQAVCDPVRSPADLARAIDNALGAENRAWTDLAADLEIDERAFFHGCLRDAVPIAELRERARTCALDRAGLKAWLGFRHQYALVRGTAAGSLVKGLDHAGERLVDLEVGFDLVLYRALARHVYRKHPGLQAAVHFGLTRARTEFQALDRKFLELERQRIRWLLYRRPVPAGVGTGRPSDFTERALLHHEAGKKGRHLPLRDLFARAITAAQQLKPCFMMSPVNAAQYLPRAINLIDLVVIDEASQVWPEDVFSSLVRAGSSNIVGDPMQLPPTSFFRGAAGGIDGGDDGANAPIDLDESVLDQAVRTFKPIRHLRWHYRSQNSRLIQFSNHYFYDNRLVVFPGPHEHNRDTGVRLFRTSGAYHASCNPEEARVVIEAARAFMRTKRGLSLGIVTLNSTQRDLLLEEFDRVALGDGEVKRYIDAWEPSLYPFFIKNLENVQGDERDVMFISTVVGRAAESDRFNLTSLGAINQPNGPRRLNVLFTRARRQVCVFSSLDPGDIPSTARDGAKILRSYLEYAAQGPLAATVEPGTETESAFERLVKERLESEGYQVVPQVGAGSYRIDLGVRHPAYPYGFLLGIECDGQHYHSGRTVRDRDRLRQMVLETLGWRIHRIWSADWFADPDREMARLLDGLERRIDEIRIELGAGVPMTVEDTGTGRYGTAGMASGAPQPQETEDLFSPAGHGLPSIERPIFLLPPPAPEMPADDDGSGPGDDPDGVLELSLAPDSVSAGALPPPADALVDPSRIVEIGDVVFYEEVARPGLRQQIQIVDGPDRPEQRIIHASKPLAFGLLNAAIGESVQVQFPNRSVELLVIGLEKASAGPSGDAGAAPPSSSSNGAPAAYLVWTTAVGLPDPTRARVDAVADGLLKIIEVEGPAAVSRVYRSYMRSAGYARLSQPMRSALNKALYALERRQAVIVVKPSTAAGYADGVVRLTGGPAVRLREIMPRDLTEVPIDELTAHLRRLARQIPDGGREEVYRECLRLAGAVRLTQQLRELFDRAWALPGD